MCGTGQLPSGIETTCCGGIPGDFFFLFEHAACPGVYQTGLQTAHVCTKYKVTPAELEGMTSDEAEAERDRKDALRPKVNELNTCLNRCMPKFEAAKDEAAAFDFDDTPDHFAIAPGMKKLREFADCEYNCRKEIDPDTHFDLAKWLAPSNTYGNPNVYSHVNHDHPEHQPSAQYQTFVNDIVGASGQFWGQDAVVVENTNEYIEEYLPLELASGLNDPDYACDFDLSFTVNFAMIINNDSCGDCLDAKMPILMADNTEKPIHTLVKGDQVKSSNGTIAKVEELTIKDWPTLTLYSINDGLLELTPDHPIMTKAGWRAIDAESATAIAVNNAEMMNMINLKEGDTLVLVDGEVVVESITPMETRTNAKTYNLRLEDSDSFYAGGVLVKAY
tara:strand:+ start:1806 stop:2975 length:1170 start_codon:yes stop_codon:yes gene_type:complete